MIVLAAIVSALHVLALAIGLPAIFMRSRALRGPLDAAGLRRVFATDAVWGIAALLWLATGLLRAFGSLEKGTAFYLGTWLFHLKLGLFALIFALEVAPMVGLIGWRIALRRAEAPDLRAAKLYARLSHAEMGLVVVMVFVAAFMARGFGRLGQ
jgi:putative membrane protein